MGKAFNYSGHVIGYDIAGSGPAVVLLHGFLESGEIWKEFSDALSGEFTVITMDLPGHGRSDTLAEIHTMSLMVEVLKALLGHLGISKAVIAGHSLGGYVAGEFAMKFPELIRGVVFFHSHVAPDTDEAKENRRRSINVVRQNHTGFIMQFIPDLFDQKHVEKYSEQIALLISRASAMKPEAVIAAITGMRDRAGSLPFLFTTEKPVLFIIGKQDPRLSYNVVLAQALIPAHSEVLLLDDVGHMGFIEAPKQTLQALRHFALKCYETL